MEEKWFRDPLAGILLGLGFIGFGVYLTLAALDYVDWNLWWAFLILAAGVPLAAEFPIRFLNPHYRIRGLIFSRQLFGVTFTCIGVAGIYSFPEWWPALLVIGIGWAIITFSIWQFSARSGPKRKR
jgi:hypothetical protein